VVAVLALAGGVAAGLLVAGGRPGGAHPTGPVACSRVIAPISRAALANGRPETPQDAGCSRSPAQNGAAGGSGLASRTICVPLPIQAVQPAAQAGEHRRCFPGQA
jgi:hypothetical protein